MYSNCCWSCSFEPEIIKIGESSHKMYSNNIVNFQKSTTILNAILKKSGNLLKAPRVYVLTHTYIYMYICVSIYIYIYICICMCVCVCVCACVCVNYISHAWISKKDLLWNTISKFWLDEPDTPTLLEKQGRARKWCTPMDPHIWPSKSRMTSPNLHTAAMWGHRM